MSPGSERWHRTKQLFEGALDLTPADRAALLEKECGDDETLRRDVESLLESDDHAGDFIEDPPFSIPRDLFPVGGDEPFVSQEFGTYTSIRELGRGGLGSVYLAARSDDEYRKEVAIKVIRRGLDTEDILRRFRNERQILAQLDHPNIARLIDGGTTDDGLPYFVMEYVKGNPLTAYTETQAPSLTDRLTLFRKICAAVTYAHQNLVIHRDLKPSNILVTADGEPKLLDFGIAKLLDTNDEAAFLTIPELRAMTPEYASPEQIKGGAITTASDIYSLGVLLFELLTGERPYRLETHTPGEIAQAVTEQEPTRPSTVISKTLGGELSNHKSLRGDLDNIVLMAMRKEPMRRYASVSQFSEDIRRHIEGHPVLAHKDTVGYRAAKFVRRHTAGVLAAAVVTLALIAGIVGTSWQARIARRERARAEQRFDDVRKLANSYLFEFHDAIENLPGSTPARALLVRRALEYLDSLGRESGTDMSLQREVVMAYVKVGNVQGNPTNSNLGDTAGALESYRKAAAIAEKWVPLASDPQMRRALAIVYQKSADVLAATNRVPKGVQSARRALAIFEELATASPTDAPTALNVAIEQLKLGDILGNPNFTNLGDSAGAMASYLAASGLLERLYSGGATDPKTRRFLGMIHERIGSLLELQHDGPGALEAYRRSAEIRLPLAAEFPNDTSMVRDGAVAFEKLGLALAASHDLEAAFENGRKALIMFETLLAADPQNTNAQHSLAVSNIHLGDLLSTAGVAPNARNAAEAIACYRKAIGLLEKASQLDSANERAHGDLAEAQAKLVAFEATQNQ